MADETERDHACGTPDDRCANCKARRYRLDALGMKDGYGECRGQEDYRTCEFYKLKPVPKC